MPPSVTGPRPLASAPDYPSDGAATPAPFGPAGRHHRLHAAATGRRADTSVTPETGERHRLRAVGELPSQAAKTSPPSPEAPARQPSVAAPASRPAEPLISWPEAFQPRTARREASGHDGQEDTGPGQPLMSPGPSGAEPDGAGSASLGSHLGMPIRVPQASLAPQLRARPQVSSQTGAREAASAEERSPEETRDMLILMQHGWERGRADDLDDPEGAPQNATD
jgi:hypothetical protein